MHPHPVGQPHRIISRSQTNPLIERPLLARVIAGIPSKLLSLALAVVGLLLSAQCGKAQAVLSTADKSFIELTAQEGLAQVKLGEMASQKGERADVKAFGLLMVNDHTAINNALRVLALRKGVILPSGLDARHQAMVDRIALVTGPGFDVAYITGMIKAHELDAKGFKTEAETTKDPDLQAFVATSAPVVEEHLKRITAMKQ